MEAVTLKQKQSAQQSFNNILSDVWSPKDVENALHFINLQMAQRAAKEDDTPLILRAALVADSGMVSMGAAIVMAGQDLSKESKHEMPKRLM